MTVNNPIAGSGRTKTCPSPSFDARHLKNAKWSSTEEINYKESSGSFKDIPKVWVPRNQPSPAPDFKPVNFDSNSLKRVKRSVSSDSAYNSPDPKDSFAWKDSTLERKLKDLKKGSLSDAPEPKNRDNDNSLGRTLDNWKSTPLPKVEDPDVLLLKKARQDKKVKQYLEQNFQNRNGKFDDYSADSEVGALQAKYLDKDGDKPSSPPHTPPPFSKAESRFEREQKIKVGSLDSFTPGAAPRERSLSPPPSASSAQARYERDRFRVQPGRIEDYRPGRCSVNSDKESGEQSNRHMQRSIKDGYESDSTLSYRKHNYNPTLTPSPKQAKQLYTQVQRGGEVPINGLRMSGSEKDAVPSITVFQSNGEGQDVSSRPGSYSSLGRRDNQRWGDMREHETEEDVKRRQQQQLNQFYSTLSLQKENELKRDQENRKHHDTLLPSQKSPVPLNRYEDQDVNGNQAVYLNAGRKPEDCKMVARALYSFQAQHHRELSFKKGDIVYIKKQVDLNWYEGERNGMVGIFPTTYVNILPSESTVSEEITRSLVRKEKSMEGEVGRAKFNFTAQTPMELSLIKGEQLTITRRIDKNWFEGRIGSRKGIFPVSYVEVENEENIKPAGTPAAHSILKTGIQPSSSYIPNNMDLSRSIGTMSPYSTLSRPTSSLSGHQDKPQPQPFRAMYNYKPQNEDEVELFEGDVVFVMEKCDDGWFVGTSQRTGIFGTFPGNYVTQV